MSPVIATLSKNNRAEAAILRQQMHSAVAGVILDKMVVAMLGQQWLCRLWVEIEAHKWRDLKLNLSKNVHAVSDYKKRSYKKQR